MTESHSLPVHAAIADLRAALQQASAAVLVAAPGAGKTTVVPLELAREPWLDGRKIVMLEPRRLAARAAARRLAGNWGEEVGGQVGYRVRFDTRISGRTRIEVVTEGVLTRLLESDRALEDYGLVIFDEFHERSLQADVGLALTLETRSVLRPDLRILVMSATIDAAAVARLLGSSDQPAPVLDLAGKLFPVETRYRPPRSDQRFEAQVAAVVREALAAERGDLLVFLPGVAEIHRVERLLSESDRPIDAQVVPLHGSLPVEVQDAVLVSGARRRVVLATSIAETSLTIPGIRMVVDGGLMRVPRFSPRTGMSRLETVRVSLASADQRRGRAGRTEPGICYRLWSPALEPGFRPHNTPEILAADLAPLALDLAAARVSDPDSLDWLDPPPEAALSQAKALLVQLGAIDQQGSISPDGLAMARLPVHPRVAHLIVRGRASGQGPLVAELAAVLGERDLIGRGSGREQPDVDLRLRLDAIRGDPLPLGIEVDRGAVERLRREVREWRRRLGVPGGKPDSSLVGELLSLAYPDRLAQKRPGQAGRYLLRNGRGAWFPPDQPLAREEFLVAVELDDAGSESRIWLAAPIGAERVTRLAAEQGARRELVEWDDGAARVRAVERLELGALVLSERPATDPDPARIRQVFLAALRRLGPGALPWTDRAVSVRQRLAFVHRLEPERWPDPSDAALLEKLEPWIGDRLEGFSRLADLADRVDLGQALVAALSAEQRRALDRLAPERFETPAGSSLEIDYADPVAPSVAVRIQELFGLAQTPTVGGGRVPLTLVLLSPARRPVQITRDLAGFWRTSYQDVRKDLKGRYPKHQWPEHPLDAAPTRRAKPRR